MKEKAKLVDAKVSFVHSQVPAWIGLIALV